MTVSLRDQHFFSPGRKRILSLDGGGVRGIISIAFLERLERVLEDIEGKPVCLGDWFDLVGGTSTGAIIATGVALGFRAAEIRDFYEDLAPFIFKKRWRLAGRQSIFRAERLRMKLTEVFGDRRLDSEDLRTGLCIVTKRLDTASSWILLNNPRSKYWDKAPDGHRGGNRELLLSALVRASTAAPNYFDPEMIEISTGMPPGLFVDGGVSPHNNPALYMVLATTLPSFDIGWSLGSENLSIFSIGTGSFRPTVRAEELTWLRAFGTAVFALKSQIADAEQLVLTLMSWLGQTTTNWVINRDFGDVGIVDPPFGRAWFRFYRYDIRLEQDWLATELSQHFEPAPLVRLRDLAAPENMKTLYKLATLAAERQVRVEDLHPLKM